MSLRVRLALLSLCLIALATIWITNILLTERFTETTRNSADVRLALYSGNLTSELQRNAVVPLLLARDPSLISALGSQDYTLSSQRLISIGEEIGTARLRLLDTDGRVVAASDRNLLGQTLRGTAPFVNALRSDETIFTVDQDENNRFSFVYSRKITLAGDTVGVILVDADMAQFERSWVRINAAVMVTDATGRIIISTEPRWRGLSEEEALAEQDAPTAIQRALKATADLVALPPDTYLEGQGVMRHEARVSFRGWRIKSFTTFTSVRERVNAVLALEIMVFAILLAMAFYLLSRRAQSRSIVFQRESAELRQLNVRLQREIAEREKAEKNLEVAEQSLAQSSKLAALGEMSAAVSHELNQPLAAMKTYLAGARLLLQRKRPDEAISSFQRIDDLIERMGSITRQLKSYARKGGDEFQPLDLRDAVASALTIMEPQLKRREVRIMQNTPRQPVMVMGDRIRVEQVIINLLRNALDATSHREDPQVEILLAAGETATLAVRDNGTGIVDLDALFEPFYTTKAPGDGVGLGLAISSGIVSDLGGRLTARNGRTGGAVFEMQLPILSGGVEAAE